MEERGEVDYSGLAVLVVDMQAFFLGNLDLTVRRELVQHQWEVVDFYQRRDVPIIGVEMELGQKIKNQRTIPILRRYMTGDQIRKKTRDAFLETELEERLDQSHCRDLIVMGLYRSECVAATIERAYQFGYHLSTASTVIADSQKLRKPLRDSYFSSYCTLFDNHQDLCSLRKEVKKD